ncbi:MAG: ankyrin repeat domain-containing protein [Candidatus Babeliales bacterium]
MEIRNFIKVIFIFSFIAATQSYLNGQEKQNKDYLSKLPIELKRCIVNQLVNLNDIGSSLEDLSSFAKVNKEFNKFINNRESVEKLAEYFEESLKIFELSPIFLLTACIPKARNFLLKKTTEEKEKNATEFKAQLFRIFFGSTAIKKLNLQEKHILNMIKILFKLKSDFDVNFQAIGNNTFLMWAVRYNFLELVKFLLAQPNININLKNSRELTALGIAKTKNAQDIISLLEQAQKKIEK